MWICTTQKKLKNVEKMLITLKQFPKKYGHGLKLLDMSDDHDHMIKMNNLNGRNYYTKVNYFTIVFWLLYPLEEKG